MSKETIQETGKKEVKAPRKRGNTTLIGRFETNTVLGERIFVVLAETSTKESDIRTAVTQLFKNGIDMTNLVMLGTRAPRTVSASKAERVQVTIS